MTPHPDEQALELDWQAAAKRVDWMQILLNLMNGQETGRDGQPCFFIGGGHFCGRAKFWPGHDDQHRFVSLLDLLERAAAPSLHKEGAGGVSPKALKVALDEIEDNECVCGAARAHRTMHNWAYCSLHARLDKVWKLFVDGQDAAASPAGRAEQEPQK